MMDLGLLGRRARTWCLLGAPGSDRWRRRPWLETASLMVRGRSGWWRYHPDDAVVGDKLHGTMEEGVVQELLLLLLLLDSNRSLLLLLLLMLLMLHWS